MSMIPEIQIDLLSVRVYFLFVQSVNGNLGVLNVCSYQMLLEHLVSPWLHLKGTFPHVFKLKVAL